MRVYNTPDAVKPTYTRNSEHDHNYGVAEAFYEYVMDGKGNPNTPLIYLPIFWAGCYHKQSRDNRDPVFRAVPAIQDVLDNLDPTERYFTVTRCDDGIYERIPTNVTVFGACRFADIPIPLTTNLPYNPGSGKRDLLATFLGQIRCGGPLPTNGRPTHSAYNPNGIGTQIRREMKRCLENQPGCLVSGVSRNWGEFVSTMQRSRFALCPRGYAPTSFRMYEAMSFGCIPVYISDEFVLPWESHLPWETFCITCEQYNLSHLCSRLVSLSNDWCNRATRRIRKYYDDWFSLTGTCESICRVLETIE